MSYSLLICFLTLIEQKFTYLAICIHTPSITRAKSLILLALFVVKYGLQNVDHLYRYRDPEKERNSLCFCFKNLPRKRLKAKALPFLKVFVEKNKENSLCSQKSVAVSQSFRSLILHLKSNQQQHASDVSLGG